MGSLGFPCVSAGKRIHLQCGWPGFNPWVGKIPWRRELLLTPVFWPGEFHGLYSLWDCKESDMTERFSLSAFFMVQLSHLWASLVAQLLKNPPAIQETGFDPWVGKIPWKRERLPTPVFWPGEFHGLYNPWVGQRVGHDWVTFTLSLAVFFRCQITSGEYKPTDDLFCKS